MILREYDTSPDALKAKGVLDSAYVKFEVSMERMLNSTEPAKRVDITEALIEQRRIVTKWHTALMTRGSYITEVELDADKKRLRELGIKFEAFAADE